jgi:hypothetical protein
MLRKSDERAFSIFLIDRCLSIGDEKPVLLLIRAAFANTVGGVF